MLTTLTKMQLLHKGTLPHKVTHNSSTLPPKGTSHHRATLRKGTLPKDTPRHSMPLSTRFRRIRRGNPTALVAWKDVWPLCVVAAS
ncbi:hypothetical protein DM860_015256 [Cuscuta australis]|uniref:Uncharacterized protein n=1 Tax=Cuscuta australis TaxID=267555 RepID=A0A328CZI9_9ASTE|nr:hypothetical protein DM860_015256 [Cuscuta australis]